jgi:hypothetical protein
MNRRHLSNPYHRLLLLCPMIVCVVALLRASLSQLVLTLVPEVHSEEFAVSTVAGAGRAIVGERNWEITATAKSTGSTLHISECGATWDAYFSRLPVGDHGQQASDVFQWTISGGEEYYKDNAAIILQKWKTLGLDLVLVVALEEDMAHSVCDSGFQAVF